MKIKILDALRDTNRDNPIGRVDLAQRIGVGERAMRYAIEEMIGEYPIGSTDGGYFMCHNAEDKRVAKRELLSRAKKLCARSNKFDYSFANWKTKKLVPERTLTDMVKNWVLGDKNFNVVEVSHERI